MLGRPHVVNRRERIQTRFAIDFASSHLGEDLSEEQLKAWNTNGWMETIWRVVLR